MSQVKVLARYPSKRPLDIPQRPLMLEATDTVGEYRPAARLGGTGQAKYTKAQIELLNEQGREVVVVEFDEEPSKEWPSQEYRPWGHEVAIPKVTSK